MAMSKSGEAAVVICLMLCLVAACPTGAEGSEYVKDGYYLGALFAHNGMSGDFDRTLVLTYAPDSPNYADQIALADVDGGAGFGVVIGRRFDWISLEIGYQRTVHDTGSLIPEIDGTDTIYSVFDLNVKIDVFARNQLRPYVLLGGGIPSLTIENGRSTTEGVTWHRDAEYRGYCLNAGVGLAYYFDPQWAVMGGLIHRWNWFNYGEGDRIDDDLAQRALGFTLGLAYTF